jgi:hypothetical protein
MRILRGLKGVTIRDRQRSENIRNLFQVNKMQDGIKEYQEKWREVMFTGCQTIDYQEQFSTTDIEENGI